MIGYAYCGSFCTHSESFEQMCELIEMGYEILPVMSENAYTMDTKFGKAKDLIQKIEEKCGRKIIHTIEAAEPIGPELNLEALIIAPCTGNTLAKIAAGITDTSVCMAAKAHLRSDRPLLIALASNDAMSANLKNIGTLIGRKNIYFVPMIQDDIVKKPHSLVPDFSKFQTSIKLMKDGKQMRPLFQEKN